MSEPWAAHRWFFVGCLVGVLAQVLHLMPLGFDLAATLRVGEASPALDVIVSDLGRVPVTEGEGHDGQYFYLIARDPVGLRGLGELTDDGGYRFRRPLSGWLAGGFGMLPPRAILWGLTLWEIVGMGLAASAMSVLTRRMGARQWAMVGVLGSIGLWVSVQLATPDALALGLALWAVVAVLDRRWGLAVVALAASALAKDSYLLFAWSVGAWLWFRGERRPAATVALVPSALLASWAVWLSFVVGGGFSAKENFGLPLAGLVRAVIEWIETPSSDLGLAVAALAAVAVGVAGLLATRSGLVRWLLAPWLAVAVLASSTIWSGGNNAVRVFVPLWAVGWLALAGATRSRTSAQRSSLRNLPV